ncbi:hypothetical protein [Pseudomonas nitroreducens]|uniref:hypothetical protein n=1 Tax=Pseudomonas nitroreducens TaxID=46680 RepID=UPI003D2D3112
MSLWDRALAELSILANAKPLDHLQVVSAKNWLYQAALIKGHNPAQLCAGLFPMSQAAADWQSQIFDELVTKLCQSGSWLPAATEALEDIEKATARIGKTMRAARTLSL